MTGVEVDFVVRDCLAALALYERVFPDVQRKEVTAYETGMNEAVFTLFGMRFHMLDENSAYQLIAPKPGDPKPMWMNILVEDIRATYARAIEAGCKEIQPITEMEDFGVINATFADPFGYLWMLHQVTKVVSFEDRCRIMEDEMGL